MGRFKIDEFPNCLKACLISTALPEKVKTMKCTMKLLCDGKEIFSYNAGTVFSIGKLSCDL